MQITNVKGRKAISPVIATVILIAITLIAAIAIAGFVFGLFGSFTATAEVTQVGSNLSATGLSGTSNSLAATCETTTPASGDSYVVLSNTGTGSTSVTAVSLILGGTTYTITTPTGCSATPIKASGTLYVVISGTASSTLAAGSTFGGSVSLANGGNVPLSGTMVA